MFKVFKFYSNHFSLNNALCKVKVPGNVGDLKFKLIFNTNALSFDLCFPLAFMTHKMLTNTTDFGEICSE